MSKQTKLMCRLAKADDFGGVMDIDRNMYGGMDYLPQMYLMYLKDPFHRCYIAEVGDTIIGFKKIYTVDDGQTVLLQAARIRNEFRGRGIIKKMEAFAIKDTFKVFPNIKRARLTSTNWESTLVRLTHNPNDCSLLVVRPRIAFDLQPGEVHLLVKSDSFKEMTKSCPVERTVLETSSSAKQILTSELKIGDFTEENIWFVNWELFDPRVASNAGIITSSSHIFTTRSHQGDIEAVSFGTIFEFSAVVGYQTDYYFLPSARHKEQILKAHVLKHLLYLEEHSKDQPISFSILHPKDFNPDLVKSSLQKELGIEALVSNETIGFAVEDKKTGIIPSKL